MNTMSSLSAVEGFFRRTGSGAAGNDPQDESTRCPKGQRVRTHRLLDLVNDLLSSAGLSKRVERKKELLDLTDILVNTVSC